MLLATLVVDLLGTIAVYLAERHAPHTELRSVGDAFFFTTVQLLTVSSQIRNPFTPWAAIIDIALEMWARARRRRLGRCVCRILPAGSPVWKSSDPRRNSANRLRPIHSAKQ